MTLLVGRQRESKVLADLLEDVRGQRSAAIVLRGVSGTGKTALLTHISQSAPDLRVLRVLGVESEMELSFAALHQLCAHLLDHLDRIPGPQREALGAAFGLVAGPPPNRFLVGLAVLTLLSDAAEERPVLCVLDNAQWLDRASAQTLAFVARRLPAESVLMMFATRGSGEQFTGLPELQVQGLDDAGARELLQLAAPWPVDERVRDRIISETRGNPLALLEITRGLSPVDWAGGFVRPDGPPHSGRIGEDLRCRIDTLSGQGRLFLVIAAADLIGDPALVRRAAASIGLSARAADDVVATELLEIGDRVVFRDPLVRSAVYRRTARREAKGARRSRRRDRSRRRPRSSCLAPRAGNCGRR